MKSIIASRRTRSVLATIAVCVALLSGREAQAVSCATFLQPYIAYGSGILTSIEVVMSSHEASGIVSASVPNPSDSYRPPRLKNNGWALTTQKEGGITGTWLFSDRFSGLQAFPYTWGDQFQLWIANDGTQILIYHPSWGSWIGINNPICEEGLMYGFGTPINSATKALYVFSLSVYYELG